MSWGVISFLIKEVLNGAPDSHKKDCQCPQGQGTPSIFLGDPGSLIGEIEFHRPLGRLVIMTGKGIF